MSIESEHSFMGIPEAGALDEQAFLNESLPMIGEAQRQEFLGYLRKYKLTVDEARKFRVAFINGQAEEFLKQRGGSQEESEADRKAA